ncbi:MAG: hypothetical protein ABIQ32_01455 [Sphingomicrobium sp.]
MMRLLAAILLTLVPAVARAADGQRNEPASSLSYEEQLIEKLIKDPPHLSKARRLPPSFKIGRCLLVVEGQTRISGKCAYRIDKGGGFLIEGPRQIYDGIDYPDARGSIALMASTDYWATVFREDGHWDGYGNDDVRGVKGEGPNFGPLRQKGACFSNERVRVCLWKK